MDICHKLPDINLEQGDRGTHGLPIIYKMYEAIAILTKFFDRFFEILDL